MELKRGRVRLRVVEGDITRMETDAVVNAANNHFWMGSGVAGAIRRAGGVGIEAEAVLQGPRPVGDAVITGAGALACRKVIHAAVMGQDLRTDFEAIRAATFSALSLAAEHGLGSIAFPAFGTGVGGFVPAESARAMFAAVDAHVRESAGGPSEITFVLFSSELKSVFEQALTEAFGA